MNIRSLGYRTDLIFPAFDGEIIDRMDYLVIRTPTNPTFYWGNFLLFSRPPREGDLERWRALFAQEIGVPPQVKHQVFGWDSPEGTEGAVQPFLAAGFRLERNLVLASTAPLLPARPSSEVRIRPLKTDADWERAVENQVACREPEFEEGEYLQFQRQQMARYRRLAASGHGDWYGAFIGRRLVADLGLFNREGVGRYQSVVTHPAFRRRGIAGTLVCEAGRQALARYGLQALVIVADQDSSPARLYASLGFAPAEQQLGLEWWPEIARHAQEGGG